MVSNNALASLVVIAIIVAVAGIMVTLSAVTRPALTGAATGTTNVSVAATATLYVVNNNVDFGPLNVGDTANTTDGSPAPFEFRNDGNVDLNISVNATALWDSPNDVTSVYYQGQCRDKDSNACGTDSTETFTNIKVGEAAVDLITNFPFQSSSDEVYFDINVTVPNEESAGAKGSVITFTAVQA